MLTVCSAQFSASWSMPGYLYNSVKTTAVVSLVADKLGRQVVVIRREVYFGMHYRLLRITTCKGNWPDHLTDNICKVTTTGCHGNFHALHGSRSSHDKCLVHNCGDRCLVHCCGCNSCHRAVLLLCFYHRYCISYLCFCTHTFLSDRGLKVPWVLQFCHAVCIWPAI